MTLTEAIKATYAVIGQSMTDIELAVIVSDLSMYPPEHVLTALTRCRRELKRVTLSHIVDRIPGSHPGAEEAWALVAKALGNEAVSVVWTEEMREAMGSAMALGGDRVAARKAFQEIYIRVVSEAQAAGRPPRWSVSYGYDQAGRGLAKLDAENRNRAVAGLPVIPVDTLALPESSDTSPMPPEVRVLVESIGSPIPRGGAV